MKDLLKLVKDIIVIIWNYFKKKNEVQEQVNEEVVQELEEEFEQIDANYEQNYDDVESISEQLNNRF